MRQFIRLKLAVLEQQLAVNANDLRAVLPIGDGKYHVWLAADLQISEERGNRMAKLGGVTPLVGATWEVTSPDLAALFEEDAQPRG